MDSEAIRKRSWPRAGLGTKLLLLTIVFVMISEVLIFVPSIANYRLTSLREAMNDARLAATIVDETPNLSDAVKSRLLGTSGILAIAERDGETRRLIAMTRTPEMVDSHVILGETTAVSAILSAFDTLLAANGRTVRVSASDRRRGTEFDVIIDETMLRREMLIYSRNILILSLAISVMTAGLVFLSLRSLFVRPVKRLAAAMVSFAEDPEDDARTVRPSARADEIGDAERSFAAMQQQLADTIGQRRRLAELGLAVSKVNHDLRNLLAAMQLISERLAMVPDPTVQRLAPKLVRSLDRAVGYTRGVLAYGKAGEAPPSRRLVNLYRLAADVGETLALDTHASIEFQLIIDEDMEIDADPDQLHRVMMNLCRNAVEALESNPHDAVVRRLAIAAERAGHVVRILVRDTGPGVPERARRHLFQAFASSGRPGGTGLGLAIAAEIVRAHGGTLTLQDSPTGASFEIEIPDAARGARLSAG